MKKFLIIIIFILFSPIVCSAQQVIVNSVLSDPENTGIYSGSWPTWTEARDATTGTQHPNFTSGSYDWGTNEFRIMRGFFPFNTETIMEDLDNYYITSATITITPRAIIGSGYTHTFVADTSNNDCITNSTDFDDVGTVEFTDRFGNGSIDTPMTIELNQAGIDYINETGCTTFVMRHSFDLDDVENSAYKYIRIWLSQDTAIYDPELTLEFSIKPFHENIVDNMLTETKTFIISFVSNFWGFILSIIIILFFGKLTLKINKGF